MKALIVNADDFGWSSGINRGIIQAHTEGILTSATLMANMPAAEEAVQMARQHPKLGVGLHLNLTRGRPLAKADLVRPLLDAEGQLRRSLPALFFNSRLSAKFRESIARELEAQVTWAFAHGLKPTHIDSHKHVHMHPAISPMVLDLARRHRIAAIRLAAEPALKIPRDILPKSLRQASPVLHALKRHIANRWAKAAQKSATDAGLKITNWFFGIYTTGLNSTEVLKYIFGHAPEGIGELMVHPGFQEGLDPKATRLIQSREVELAALCDADVKRAVSEGGWALKNYRDLLDYDKTSR